MTNDELEARRRQKDGLLFINQAGEPWKPASITTLFKAIMKRAGVGPLRFHDLRHTAGSLMLEANVLIPTVSRILGHANASITMSIYAHAIRGAEDRASQAMDGVFKGTEAVR